MRKREPKRKKNQEDRYKITKIQVSGYKSVNEPIEIEVGPLTILGGTNSTGKSSFIQPLLLMKQTLEEGFDPGALLLNGPHVKFSSVDQILHTKKSNKKSSSFSVGFEMNKEDYCEITYKKQNNGFIIQESYYKVVYYNKNAEKKETEFRLKEKMDPESLSIDTPDYVKDVIKNFEREDIELQISRDRCFQKLNYLVKNTPIRLWEHPNVAFHMALRNIIHLPGLRGNPERNYPTTAIDSDFESTYLPGSFEKYVASLIYKWQIKDEKKLQELEKYINKLGLTNKVRAEKINDTQVSINVGRNISNVDEDSFVNIADVGLGVSQTLPVLVALVYAKPGQMVYIEQPEIHLHPKAQYMFAEILGDAVLKGVRVVIETHSSLIIKGIQTAVAKKKIKSDLVKLHWFSIENETGESRVVSTTIKDDGSFGDWPIDFDEIEITAEMNYLYASEDEGL